MTRHFVVCLHDATPAYARETRAMIRDLAPMVGRRVAFGIVPDWHGKWALTAHPDYCALVRESTEEILLHGYSHQRLRGQGLATMIAGRCDEMNGLDAAATHRTIERGQRALVDAFGEPARGFLAPAWQRGHVRRGNVKTLGLDYVLGYFALEAHTGRRVRLATWMWDCGRWGWLGHVGHGIGWLSQSLNRGVPALAIHPRDLEGGFWPTILDLTRALVDRGYEPSTVAGLLEGREC